MHKELNLRELTIINKFLYSFWDVCHSYEVERDIFRKGEGIVGKVYRDGVPVPIKISGEIIGLLTVLKDFGEESVERSVELLMGMLYKLEEQINQEREEWEEEKRLRIVGKSPAVRKLLEALEKVAQTDANVLNIENTEREEMLKALEKTGYVKSRATKLLGYTLKYRIPIKRY